MTIIEAIQTAIDNLEGVRLPVRDGDNANRIRSALSLLDAMKEFVTRKTDEPNDQDTTEEATDE